MSSSLSIILYQNSKFHPLYHPYQSTESAFLRVFNDKVHYIDDRKTDILILLNLSAAFDTIDHEMPLERLNSTFQFIGNVLDWFRSYLSDRFQVVIIKMTLKSLTEPLKSEIP